MDAISQSRLAEVHPLLAAKITELFNLLSPEGIILRVTQGLRTYQEQDALYAQGRPDGKRVTNARGGESYHNFGLAVDCVPGVRGEVEWVPNWNAAHPDYKRMASAAGSLGLVSGLHWTHLPDPPHLQMTGTQPEDKPTADAEATLRAQGVAAVWKMAGL